MLSQPRIPPTVPPPAKPLSLFATIRAAKTNVLGLIPAIAYRQPMVSGRFIRRWHMVQDPAALRRVFLDNVANYPKAEIMLRMLRPAIGDSLFTAEGEPWLWQRRAVAPVFAQRNVVALAPAMTRTAERASARLAAEGEATEILGVMLSATFDVICEVALSGRRYFDADAYGEAIVHYFERAGKASILDFLQVPDWVPRPGAVLARRSVRTMHRMVSEAIDARIRGDTSGADDLLDHMLHAADPETGRPITQDLLLHNMQFFIVAGHETTAIALSWALLLLALDPDSQARARDEARSVLGGAPAEARHIDATPFIGQVIQEAMRLYPPVAMLARTAKAPDVLCGRDVLAGDILFLPIYALHRHELWWDDGNAFDPGNFTPERVRTRDRFLYLPFGAGPRVCVGANFAMMQAHIILATVLARFRFAPAGPLPEPTMTMTLRPKGGVRLAVSRA